MLLPTIAEAAIAILDRDGHLPLIGDTAWFAWLVDVFAVAVLAGVATAVWIRRCTPRPGSAARTSTRPIAILAMITAIVVSLLPGRPRVALGLTGADGPVSAWLAGWIDGVSADALEVAERGLVWLYLLLVLAFLVYLPGSKHLHIVTAAPNVWLRKAGPAGGSSCASTSRRPRKTCRSGPASPPTCPVRRPRPVPRAPSADAARTSVPRGPPGSRSARSC